jgi:hypothetical protein
MKPVPEMPNNPIPQLQAEIFENPIVENIERVHFSFFDIIADLPTNAAPPVQNPNEFRNDVFLSVQVFLNGSPVFVRLSHIVRRRRDHELHGTVFHRSEKMKRVVAFQRV